jgi:hypothetical protein
MIGELYTAALLLAAAFSALTPCEHAAADDRERLQAPLKIIVEQHLAALDLRFRTPLRRQRAAYEIE